MRTGVVTAMLAVVACQDGRQASRPPAPSKARASPPIAASHAEGGAPFSIDSALALFRQELPAASGLRGGATSMQELVRELAAGIEQRDTATLRDLMLTRAEFAYLYYPTSPHTRSPTKQEPHLAWFLHLQGSQKGATRLFNRYGGAPLRVVGHHCTEPPRREGRNVLWDDCVVRVVRGDTVATRLFAGIIERDGRFKILSYANDL